MLEYHIVSSVTMLAAIMTASLPDELWLQILHYLEPQDVWLNTHKVSRQLESCSEDIIKNNLIRHFTISLSFTLGTSTRARWYDIRGSTTLRFTRVSQHNPQYAVSPVLQ